MPVITSSPDREPGDLQLAKLLGQSVGAIGGAFMLHPDTLTLASKQVIQVDFRTMSWDADVYSEMLMLR